MVPIPPHSVHLTALDAMTPMALLDPGGVIIAVSPAWRQPENATPSRVLRPDTGTNYIQVCSASADPDAHRVARGIRRVMAGELPVYVQEFSSRPQEGEPRVRLRVTSLSDGSGPAWTIIVQEALPGIAGAPDVPSPGPGNQPRLREGAESSGGAGLDEPGRHEPHGHR